MKPAIRPIIAAFSVFLFASLAAFASDPSGVWKFTAEAAGRNMDSTLTLRWADNQLSGSLNNRAGKVDISEARFIDDQVIFTVTRDLGKRLRKKTFTIHYAGKLEGDSIEGTIETTGRDKKRVSVVWKAQRVK